MEEQRPVPAGVDATIPNVARMWDYQLGGKDNYPADRAAAEAVNEALSNAGAPTGREAARDNRAFIHRAVRYLAGEAGIRQFVDIGSGLPSMGNVHEVAHAVAPDAKVVYVDIDPVVVAHARALLAETHTPTPRVVAVRADLRQPEEILSHPDTRRLIDLDRAVAVLLVAALHLLTGADDPYGIVARLRDAMAPGSYLALTHATPTLHKEAAAALAAEFERWGVNTPIIPRSRDDIARFFDGFDLVEPGLVFPSQWRAADHEAAKSTGAGWMFAGVGRKP